MNDHRRVRRVVDSYFADHQVADDASVCQTAAWDLSAALLDPFPALYPVRLVQDRVFCLFVAESDWEAGSVKEALMQ